IHMSSVLQEIEASAKKTLEEIRRERIPAVIQVRSFVTHGNPANEIVSLAAREKADIIVMAPQGESGWQRFVFGSVAERVVRIAD
ncbi:MAG: universal stress protein, partial [Desulfobacterales bacterium]